MRLKLKKGEYSFFEHSIEPNRKRFDLGNQVLISVLKVTHKEELELKMIVYSSSKNPNPNCNDYQKVWVNKMHLILNRGAEFKESKKMYFGMCANQQVTLVLEMNYFGFTDEFVKQSLKDHRKKVDVFKKFPFNQLSPEEKAAEIKEMRKTRLALLRRDFVLKNIKTSKLEHQLKVEKIASNQVIGN